jgi:hypothetical protein
MDTNNHECSLPKSVFKLRRTKRSAKELFFSEQSRKITVKHRAHAHETTNDFDSFVGLQPWFGGGGLSFLSTPKLSTS